MFLTEYNICVMILPSDLNINVGLVGDDCNSCAATGSSCVDYGAGSCCVCNVNYMGNGISCLRNGTVDT